MPRGGIEGLQTPQIRPGLVRQDHAGAGIVFPRGGLHRHRRLGGDHMGIQDLQAIGPKNPGHGILRPPGLRAALHHLPADIQGIFHQGFPFRSRHWRPPLLSHHASSPVLLADPMLGGCHILPQSVRNYKWRSPQKGRKGLLGFHGKPTHSILPLTAGEKSPIMKLTLFAPSHAKEDIYGDNPLESLRI